jgi:hypothetical protein
MCVPLIAVHSTFCSKRLPSAWETSRTLLVLACVMCGQGCKEPFPLYCDETTPCSNPAQYCDLTGEFSGGAGNICVPNPFDAGLHDAASVADAPTTDAASPTMSFAGQIGDSVAAVVVDSEGDIVVVGEFEGTTDLGNGPITAGPDGSFFLAKYGGRNGAHIWSKQFPHGPYFLPSLRSIATSPDGAIGLTGTFHEYLDLGATTLMTSPGTPCCAADGFIAVFLSDGSYRWSRQIELDPDGPVQFFNQIGMDDSGNVFIGGGYAGSTNFGGGGVSSSVGVDPFIASYRATDGAYRWGRVFPSSEETPSAEMVDGLAVDSAGNVVVIGTFLGDIDFGSGTPISPAGGIDSFFAKYRGSDGFHFFSRRVATTGGATGGTLTTGPTDDIIIAGRFLGTVNLGGGSLSSDGDADVFVAGFSQLGGHDWSTAFTAVDAWPMGSAVTGGPSSLVVGHFSGSAQFGTNEHFGDAQDGFVIEVSMGTGEVLTSTQVGSAGSDQILGVALHQGARVLVGKFQQTVDFGADVLTADGTDGFVVQLAP